MSQSDAAGSGWVELTGFSTAALSDALDELGVVGAVPGLWPLSGRRQRRVAGPALTARFERRQDREAHRFGGTVGRPLEQVLQAMQPSEVVVMDLQGAIDASAWGGLASRLAQRQGVVGTVIHGTVRDREEIEEAGYPVWCVGTHPRRSRNHFTFGDIRQPIRLGPVEVRSGDIIVGDATGVVCVPRDRVDETLRLARQITDTEGAVSEQIESDRDVDWDAV